MQVVVAGTFGPIHDGHRALLREALRAGDEGVVVGLTNDEFANAKRDREVPSYADRRTALAAELDALDEWDRDVEIRPIDDEYDLAATDPDLDAVVVSAETADEVADVNRRRERRGLDPLAPVEAPLVTAEDGGRISSTRIVEGEIDEHGNLLR